MKWRKKPVVIDAEQWTGENFLSLQDSFFPLGVAILREDGLYIRTLEGDMKALPGDYIIRGVQNEYYPCREDIFYATYEKHYE